MMIKVEPLKHVKLGDNHPKAGREVANQEEDEKEEEESEQAIVDVANVPESALLGDVGDLVVHFEQTCDPHHLVQPQDHVNLNLTVHSVVHEDVVQRKQSREIQNELLAQVVLSNLLSIFNYLKASLVVPSVKHNQHVQQKQDFDAQVY